MDSWPVVPAVRRSTRPPRPEVTSEGTSRRRLYEVESHRRFLYPCAHDPYADTQGMCSTYMKLAHIAMARSVDSHRQHDEGQEKDLSLAPRRHLEAWWSVIERRI